MACWKSRLAWQVYMSACRFQDPVLRVAQSLLVPELYQILDFVEQQD